jgi:hypothetical protein
MQGYIENTHFKIDANVIIDSPVKFLETEQTIEYIVHAYGFLVPLNKKITLLELADLIESYYSMSEPRNKFVVDFLRN